MQAEKLGLAMKNSIIEAVYSSPLQRAMDTAKSIASFHDINVEIDNDLREIDAGEMEGVMLGELVRDFSHYLIEYRDGKGEGKLPGGESLYDLRRRAWKVTQNILQKHAESVVIVSHYFVTLSIICAALDLPVDSIRKMRVKPGSVTIIDFIDNIPVLTSFNDTCHLG